MAYQTSSLNPDQSVSPTALPPLSLLVHRPALTVPPEGRTQALPSHGTETHFPGIHPEPPPGQGLPPAGISSTWLAPLGGPDPQPVLSLLEGVELEA